MVCVDDVSLLGENMRTRKNTEALLVASKQAGLDLSAESCVHIRTEQYRTQ
jgi:hypothetical protein